MILPLVTILPIPLLMPPLMPPARLSQMPLGDRVGAALLDLWCFVYVTLPFTSASLILEIIIGIVDTQQSHLRC